MLCRFENPTDSLMTTKPSTRPAETCPLCGRSIDVEPAHGQYLELEAIDETGLVSERISHQLCGGCWTHLEGLCVV